MVKVLNLRVERMVYKKIKDKETGKESEIFKVLYENVNEDNFYIGYLSMFDVNKLEIAPGLDVQAIYDQGKIKILG